MSLELLDRITIMGMNAYLARQTPRLSIKSAEAALLIRLDGDKELTTLHANKISDLLSKEEPSIEPEIFEGGEHQRIWKARDNAGPSLGRLSPSVQNVGTFMPASLDFSVPFSNIPELMKRFAKIVGAHNIGFVRYGHLGDGNVHLICTTPITSEEDVNGCGVWKAPYLPLEHGKDAISLMKSIKNVFDPNNIMNPGKLYTFPKAFSIFSMGNSFIEEGNIDG
jgi:glycolate oxidase